MIRQHIYLPTYRWKILVYYWAGVNDADEILGSLKELGASDSTLESAEDNLCGVCMDTGLTYTNDAHRGTVVVISASSSPEEFWDTLDHEKGHAVQHIASALGMDYMGEEQQYLAGEIARKMHPVARLFICAC